MSIQSCLASTYLFHSVPSICLSTTALGWRSPEALSPSSNSCKWYHFQAATPRHWCKPQQETDFTWGNGVVPNSSCVTKQLPASLWSQLCMFSRIWQAQSREYSVNLVCPHLLVYESKKKKIGMTICYKNTHWYVSVMNGCLKYQKVLNEITI